jgi:hypothetical protein
MIFDEWDLFLPGGAFYNSTGLIIAGDEQYIDISGLLATEFFDYTNPAYIGKSFAGNISFF